MALPSPRMLIPDFLRILSPALVPPRQVEVCRKSSLGARCARAVCPSAEPAGAALPSSSSGEAGAGAVASLPDEGIAPQRARGVLNLTRQRGCFHCKTAAKGCWIPLPLFIGHHVRAWRACARPSAAPRSPLGASWGGTGSCSPLSPHPWGPSHSQNNSW